MQRISLPSCHTDSLLARGGQGGRLRGIGRGIQAYASDPSFFLYTAWLWLLQHTPKDSIVTREESVVSEKMVQKKSPKQSNSYHWSVVVAIVSPRAPKVVFLKGPSVS